MILIAENMTEIVCVQDKLLLSPAAKIDQEGIVLRLSKYYIPKWHQ